MSKSKVILKGNTCRGLPMSITNYSEFKEAYKSGMRNFWFGRGNSIDNKRELCGKTVTVSFKFGARKRLLKGTFCTDGTSYWVEYDTFSATKRAIDDLWLGLRHLTRLIQEESTK